MRYVFCTLFALLLAGTAISQSLADVAKKEKERRATNKAEQTRTITDDDLRSTRFAPATTSTVAADGTTDDEGGEGEDDAEAEDEQTEQEDPRQTEEYWRNRLSGVDGKIRALQAELDSPLNTSDPRGAPRRQRLEQDLAQAQAERGAIVDEARRAGAPPGWLR